MDRKHELRRAIRGGLCSCAAHASVVVVVWRACFCRAAAHNQRALVVLISGYISYQQLFLPGAQFKKILWRGGVVKRFKILTIKPRPQSTSPPSFLLITGLPACFRFLIFFAALPSPPPSTWPNSDTTFYLYYKVCSTTSACEMQCKFIWKFL